MRNGKKVNSERGQFQKSTISEDINRVRTYARA